MPLQTRQAFKSADRAALACLEAGNVWLVPCSCKARLGSYNWAGIQNESGKWICPGFQLHMSRLDTERPSDPPVAIRLPKI